MGRYLSGLNARAALEPEASSLNEETEIDGTSESTTEEEYEEYLHDSEPADMSEISTYRDCVVGSAAYEWLQGTLSAEAT